MMYAGVMRVLWVRAVDSGVMTDDYPCQIVLYRCRFTAVSSFTRLNGSFYSTHTLERLHTRTNHM